MTSPLLLLFTLTRRGPPQGLQSGHMFAKASTVDYNT